MIDNGAGGEYRAAMTLLAITTGAPGLANMVLSRLARAPVDQTLATFIAEFEPLMAGDPWREERRCLTTAFSRYAAVRGGVDKVAVEELHGWAPEVSRFKLRAGAL